MEYFAEGDANTVIDSSRLSKLVDRFVSQLRRRGPIRRVLLLPPDFTRYHSAAGELSTLLYRALAPATEVDFLPAIGTHKPMTADEIATMFPGIPPERFFEHDWRHEVVPVGDIPAERIRELSEGKLDFSIRVELNRRIVGGGYDAVVSIGQLVPHEVVGIANHSKNVFVGCGGSDLINKSHYLGAVYGMERYMGRPTAPVRAVLDDAAALLADRVPIDYLLTVRARDSAGQLVTRGLFAGNDSQCFHTGAKLCAEVNLDRLDRAPKKVVVWLDPGEFKSTWLGNKAIYRTRMAIADGGELIILGPGVREFGEQPDIDAMIREFGYRGTPAVLDAVRRHTALAGNLAAAAHLIHSSSEGRFRITYCPGNLTRLEIEGVGYHYAELDKMMALYHPDRLTHGWNRVGDEDVFYIANPALGLWCADSRV